MRSVIPINVFYPEIMRSLRMSRGLNQAEFARELKCAPSLVSYWESGRRFPSGNNAVAVMSMMREQLLHDREFEEDVKRILMRLVFGEINKTAT